ncbi:hypothetical protein ACFFUP_18945 [Vibrio ostreicida]|uniref:Uncharacterized protein n=1 Tax=Vibrio ostreicida TaxID=526588 RepID=A0ABT8BZ54_9VIBR|nr:hypothetical protein [Vibrio ostreicida]MDN3612376.1 hypothetical protein [Vibrio ostreicida]NPD09853.1 hypothetical protein [Vibrio ostreicida]
MMKFCYLFPIAKRLRVELQHLSLFGLNASKPHLCFNPHRMSALTLIICLIMPTITRGHALEETSARLYVRDQQIELTLSVDVDNWMRQLPDIHLWLLGGADTPSSERRLMNSTLHSRLSYIIQQGTRLVIDETPAQLIPAPYSPDAQHSHIIEFRFSATHTQASPKAIDIQFPPSLGNVHFSVVQPIYQQIPAGVQRSLSLL